MVGHTSIVMLTLDALDYTQGAIESIRLYTPQPYELIVVDNGSADKTRDYVRTVPGARLVSNAENLGYARGNNQGLALAAGDPVVLLNNDVLVAPGWLERMLDVLERDPSVGIVGPRSNYVAGRQRFPEVPYRDQTGFEEFAFGLAERHRGEEWPVPWVAGFCLVVRRAVVDQIGGLDPRFGLGNYEDNDFCLRAGLAGWSCRIAVDAFVHHFGHRTFEAASVDWRAAMDRNRSLFLAKWGIAEDDGRSIPAARIFAEHRFDPLRDYCPLPVAPEVVYETTGVVSSATASQAAGPSVRDGTSAVGGA